MGEIWSHTKSTKDKISEFARTRYKDNSKLTNCLQCAKQYRIPLSRYKNGRGKYCSKKCQYINKQGIRYSIGTEFKKGQVPWNKGADCHYGNYKGDEVSIRALHNWVARKLGKPSKCEHCNITNAKRYEWSNISKKYKRDLSDWQRLCTRCHMIYDGHSIVNNNKKKTR